HHSDWTPAQKSRYLTENSQAAKRLLLRTCGYGIPNSQRVLHCMRNRVSLIAQETIQPYRLDGTRGTMNEMCIFQLPWPKETLFAMAEKSVHLRVTLSYFIEPSPAKRGWTNRYRYASHGLRFDLRRLNESHEAFNKRVNVAMRDADDEIDAPDDSNWLLGDKLRRHGSIHSDQWSGMAIDLAERDLIAIHPVVGWWRERINRGRCETQTRFSLVVSLETEDNTVDLYNEIKKQIEIPMALELEK
ncbi:MAG: hypothetical protein VB032_08150, partial [Burkholderiaceae bacterium]|nr:hypothetical protein [Burkholderiaceae bacterium]